jgi:hypothetical protein
MKFAPSKLFHAVVITGAALTGCAGTARKPAAPADSNAAAAGTGVAAPVNTPETGGTQNSGGTCPPGSERPYPPCYWIK